MFWLINYCSCNVRYRFKEQIVSIFEYISGIKHALNNIWATERNLICWTWCVDMFKILTSKCQIIWEGFVLFFRLWSTLLGLSYNKSFVYNKLWCFISAGFPWEHCCYLTSEPQPSRYNYIMTVWMPLNRSFLFHPDSHRPPSLWPTGDCNQSDSRSERLPLPWLRSAFFSC